MSEMKLFEAGAFGKPHGIKGEISASLDADDIDIVPGDFVFARIDGLDVPFRVAAVRTKGAGYLLTLKGITDERTASMLANKPLFLVDSDDYAGDDDDDDRLYLDDLIGFTLTDNGRAVGTISDYTEPTEHNPLFVVATASGEILVPASENLIESIDLDKKTIDMSLPEGLVDLNSSK